MPADSSIRLDAFTNPVKQEFLLMEITGDLSESDYIGQSVSLLQDHAIPPSEELTKFSHEDSFAFEDADVMLQPGNLEMENGWVRRNDGSMFIACSTDLGYEVNGDMFDWWFCHCDDSDKYRWWHPYDHIKGTWDPSYYAAMPFERIRGHYVDHIHIVEEKIGGEKQSLQIEFMRPSKVFDVTKFTECNVTACLVARVYVKDPLLGMIGAGHLIHMVREINGRSELRSRFWIGDEISYPETPENYYFAQLVQSVSSSFIFKTFKIPYDTGKNTYVPCSQEMACLAKFLPHYYKVKTEEMKEFQKKFLNAL